jgi:hypothetical protein
MEKAAGELPLAPLAVNLCPGDQMQAAPFGGEHTRHGAAAADPLHKLALPRPERSPLGGVAAVDIRTVERPELARRQRLAHVDLPMRTAAGMVANATANHLAQTTSFRAIRLS